MTTSRSKTTTLLLALLAAGTVAGQSAARQSGARPQVAPSERLVPAKKLSPAAKQGSRMPSAAPSQNLQELDDAELYFEAYYRRYFRLDMPAALEAFELLGKRRDSRFQRLALVRLIEIYRDSMRYDRLAATLMRIRDDRKSGLSGAQRSQVRAWVRDIERHEEALDEQVAQLMRTLERKSGRAPTPSQIERARRELSLQRIRSGGKNLLPLRFGSRFFAIALRPYAGREPDARAALRDKSRGRPSADGAQPEMRRPPQRDLQWHKAMVHRLAQKKQLRKGEGRKELLRLYDDRIRRHLLEMGRIHLRQLRQAPKPRREAMLRQLRQRFLSVERGLELDQRAKLGQMRRDFFAGLEDPDWKKLEQQLKTAIDEQPMLLQRFFTAR